VVVPAHATGARRRPDSTLLDGHDFNTGHIVEIAVYGPTPEEIESA
jgi:hypothetical protein